MTPENDLDFEEPSPELLNWAKEHIREDPSRKCQVISDFRDLIFANNECVPIRSDDAFLLRFLRARHFYLKHAYQLFLNYHSYKEENPDFFKNVDSERIVDMIKKGTIISINPYREASGKRILIFKSANWSPTDYSVTELFQAIVAIIDLSLMEQRTQILGGVCILNLEGLTMQQASYLTPSIARKLFELLYSSQPLKLMAMHILNESFIFNMVYNIVKPFMTDFMTKRVIFHGNNLESLHKHIDPQYLPPEYGGTQTEGSLVSIFRRDDRFKRELRSLGYTFIQSS